jgi:hypothetical protein
LEIARGSLVQQFLQSTTVVQTAAYFGHQFLRNIKGKPAPCDATVEGIAGVLFPGKTGRTVLAYAGAAAQTEGAEQGRPEVGGFLLEPVLDIGRRFGFRLHVACMSSNTHTCQAKSQKKYEEKICRDEISPTPDLTRHLGFRDRN